MNCRGEGCKRTRPKKQVAKHKRILRDMPYDQGWPELSVEIHGGELHACAVCKRAPTKTKRHDRDHDHYSGQPRGVCCSYCNRERLRGIRDSQEARAVLLYFENVEKYYRQTEEEE